MLLAMSLPELGDRFPGLRTYARDPSALGLPPELQIYLVLYVDLAAATRPGSRESAAS